jgi:hypothetical protein
MHSVGIYMSTTKPTGYSNCQPLVMGAKSSNFYGHTTVSQIFNLTAAIDDDSANTVQCVVYDCKENAGMFFLCVHNYICLLQLELTVCWGHCSRVVWFINNILKFHHFKSHPPVEMHYGLSMQL